VAWNKEGLSSRAIAARLERDKAMINRVIRKARQQGDKGSPCQERRVRKSQENDLLNAGLSEEADHKIPANDGS
jgi:transposase